jgi:hypothetical protein
VDLEILAYIGAALMVVLAWLAYRYWQRTPTFARRMRESYSDQVMRPLLAPATQNDASVEAEPHPDETTADLPLIGQLSEVTDLAADETQEELAEAPSESNGVETLLPTESIGDSSEPEAATVDIDQQASMVEDHKTGPAVFTSESSVEIPKEAPEAAAPELVDSETLPAGDGPLIDAAEPADEVVAPLINGNEDSVPFEHGSQEAVTPGDPEPDPSQPADGSTQPELETTNELPADVPPEPAAASLAIEDGEVSEEIPMKPEHRLIEELEPRTTSHIAITDTGSVAALLKGIEEELAALPSGIELIDLPILERRRIAGRREELLSDRELLLEQKGRGAQRRRKGSRPKG